MKIDLLDDPVYLATVFHSIYERRAPEFGYETRQETRSFDTESANGRLMIAVCGEIQAMWKYQKIEAERNALQQGFSTLRQLLHEGYRSGCCMTNDHGCEVALNYDSNNHAESAFNAITDLIDAARGEDRVRSNGFDPSFGQGRSP
jgi:hypothetical protein